MKHTKGPWEYFKSVGEDQPRVLSTTITEFGNFYVALCNVDADAQLIAAAPELLEALKTVSKRLELEEQERPGSNYILAAYRAEILMLIAKATGQKEGE